MSVIRWLVVQEVCSRFEFARHFESHLTRPPPFFMCMQTRTTSVEHSIAVPPSSTDSSVFIRILRGMYGNTGTILHYMEECARRFRGQL